MKFLCMTGLHSMTEKNLETEQRSVGLSETEAGESAGSMLRAAREAAGLHVAALAVAMKVPVKKLEALEADRLDLLPDAVFVRALASSVCRNLKIDSTPVLARLPHHGVPRLGDAPRSINTPFHPSGEGRVWVFPSALKQPALLLTVLLILAAFALWILPEWQAQSVDHTTQLTDAPVPTQSNAPAEPMVAPAADVVVGNASAADGTSLAPVAPDAVAAPLPAVANALVSNAEPKAPRDSLLVLTARGPSWVEVADAKGQILVRRNLAGGESVMPTGQLPLSVVVGRADMTDVVVRGKTLDLVGTARENVARFEVK
jgi:cytoskeleton protein RodZ